MLPKWNVRFLFQIYTKNLVHLFLLLFNRLSNIHDKTNCRCKITWMQQNYDRSCSIQAENLKKKQSNFSDYDVKERPHFEAITQADSCVFLLKRFRAPHWLVTLRRCNRVIEFHVDFMPHIYFYAIKQESCQKLTKASETLAKVQRFSALYITNFLNAVIKISSF